MSDLLALAERCEAASGRDEDLDWDIREALGAGWWASLNPCPWTPRSFSPTRSVDAAMTLIGDEHWRVEDHPLAGPCSIVGEQEGYAATPALALTAAALRARHASHPTAIAGAGA